MFAKGAEMHEEFSVLLGACKYQTAFQPVVKHFCDFLIYRADIFHPNCLC
jgi:hypothetical protein